ncbi:uncharacterized protein [Drosophila takahashii]|uniref:uncharacterized protein n=1 Tax=Drosophila takahashii TaxID=29030 RepID=UPI003898E1BF
MQWTNQTTRKESNSVRFNIRVAGAGATKTYWLNNVHTVKNLGLPKRTVNVQELRIKFPHLDGIPLQSYWNAEPMILIGNNNWKLAVPRKVKEGKWNDPIASKCILGWGLQGSTSPKTVFSMHHCQCNWDKIEKSVRESFCVESVTPKTFRSVDDEKALEILDKTCSKSEGHYQVGLLWRNNNPILPESYNNAVKRLNCLKAKINREPELFDKIEVQINNLLKKGYANELSSAELVEQPERVWYLPIFITHNPNKPQKVRLVWDAAAKSHGSLLNDFMYTGPDLLHPLTEVLMAFRVGKIAVCGDIAEMFHQIRILEADAHAQRFVWYNKETQAIRTFVMRSMTFGISCAPCIAHYVRDKNAEEYKLQSPRAFEAITKAHYVDDYIDSLANETYTRLEASILGTGLLIHPKS